MNNEHTDIILLSLWVIITNLSNFRSATQSTQAESNNSYQQIQFVSNYDSSPSNKEFLFLPGNLWWATDQLLGQGRTFFCNSNLLIAIKFKQNRRNSIHNSYFINFTTIHLDKVLDSRKIEIWTGNAVENNFYWNGPMHFTTRNEKVLVTTHSGTPPHMTLKDECKM